MSAQEISERIPMAEKKTPFNVNLKGKKPVNFPNATVFPCGETKLVFGDWKDVGPVLKARASDIAEMLLGNDSRNSAIPLLDTPQGPEAEGRQGGGKDRPGGGFTGAVRHRFVQKLVYTSHTITQKGFPVYDGRPFF